MVSCRFSLKSTHWSNHFPVIEAGSYNNCELEVKTYFDLQASLELEVKKNILSGPCTLIHHLQGYNLDSFASRTKKQPGSLLMHHRHDLKRKTCKQLFFVQVPVEIFRFTGHFPAKSGIPTSLAFLGFLHWVYTPYLYVAMCQSR